MKHSIDTIIQVFQDIDSGKVTNFHSSDANVVMISKDYYYALLDNSNLKQEVS